MLEKTIERHIAKYAKNKGIITYKFSSPAKRSVPDRIFIAPPNGNIIFIEFKQKNRSLSKLQSFTFNLLLKSGCKVYLVDSIESGKKIIDAMSNE